MKKLVLTATLAFASVPTTASAAVTFSLDGVTFARNGTASGSFTTDDAVTVIQTFDINTSAGTFDNNASGGTFSSGGGRLQSTEIGSTAVLNAARTTITFANSSGIGRLTLLLAQALGEGATTISGGEEGRFLASRQVAGGQLISSMAAVPEPATWGLMLAGFGMVGAGLRTRRRSVTFAAV